jgi:hydroxyacylglutathione hydrolase
MKAAFFAYVLGPLENNSYLLVDLESGEAALIDPSFDVDSVLADAQKKGWRVASILLTHGHFDHIAGVSAAGIEPIALHPADLELYRQGGGARNFGIPFEAGPMPNQMLQDGETIKVGSLDLEVHHTPGHTPGHVIFVCRAVNAAFCGDLIFAGSVGRTDLPGGSHSQLLDSIQRQILTLPPDMVLLPGHGPSTTVGEEAASNPFL